MVFLEWQNQARRRTKDFRLIVRCEVANEITVSAALKIAAESGAQYHYFEAAGNILVDEDAAKALLGTPQSDGVSWFLINLKVQLGCKEVKSIKVFAEQTQKAELERMKPFYPSIAFSIGDCREE